MAVRGHLALAAAALVGCVAMWFVDPNQPNSLWPPCPLYALTGIQCPACGSTRMVHALVHGDFAAAWQFNAMMLIVGLPVLVWLWVRSFNAARHATIVKPIPRLVAIPVVVVAGGWMLLRNLVV